MRTRRLLAAGYLLTGCQPGPAWTSDLLPLPARAAVCSPEPAEPGRCAARCGSYNTSFEQIAGDCGSRPNQFTQLSGDPTRASFPCRGSFATSIDRCFARFDIRCPTKDDSGATLASIEQGTLQWSADATRALGALEMWIVAADAELLCRSQYRVSIQRSLHQ